MLMLGGCRGHMHPPLAGPHGPYRVQQTVTLRPADVGDARLELLEDARITPSIRAVFQRGLPDDACADSPADSLRAFCAAIVRRPLLPALLRLIDGHGTPLDSVPLERSIGDIVLAIPASGARPAVFGVSVDLSAEAGSYSGPLLQLLDPRDRRLRWLRARDVASDSTVDVFLPTTLKTGWKIIPADGGAGPEILLVACRPAFGENGSDFKITYTRFFMERGGWRRVQRTVPGFWENEGDFPVRSLFP